MRTTTASVQLLLPLLRVASTERVALLYWLKQASVQDDAYARLTILEGALGARQWSLSGGGRGNLVRILEDLRKSDPQLAGVNPDWFSGDDFHFRESIMGAARDLNLEGRTGYTDQDLAQALSSGVLLTGRTTESLYYRFGHSMDNAILSGMAPGAALRVFRSFAKKRALDVLKLKKRREQGAVGIDTQIGDEGGRTLAEMISNSNDYDLVEAAFDTPEGHQVLRDFDRYLTPAFSSAPQQLLLWEAVRDNPDIVGSPTKMADAYSQRTGAPITGPGVKKLWDKILLKIQETVGQHPELIETLEGVRSIKQMFRMAAKRKQAKAADLEEACWEGYEAVGMKEKGGKKVPNCVPVKK